MQKLTILGNNFQSQDYIEEEDNMFSKTGPTKGNAFEKEVASDQRKLLQENLEKLSVPANEQKKIIEMRDSLPKHYHEMLPEKPSRCFWFLENVRVPERTKNNQHHFDAFEKCEREILNAIRKDEAEEPSIGRMKP